MRAERSFAGVIAAFCTFLFTFSPVFAQNSSKPKAAVSADGQHEQIAVTLNANTLTIISGNINGTYLKIADDMAAVLDRGDELRVLPIIGKGGAQNLRDILYLKGVDMGIVPVDCIRYFKENSALGSNFEHNIRYITKLYNEELHILVTQDIKDFRDLEGKVVNFSDAGGATQVTARYLFENRGVHVKEVNMGQADAIEKMKTGQIAATVLVAGRPAGVFANIKSNELGFHFVDIPYSMSMHTDYLPSHLSHDDYPTLITEDKDINTIAVGAVLIAYNWPEDSDRYRRIAKFVDAFYANIDKFQLPPRHVKWQELNFATNVIGLTRMTRAQQLINSDPRSSKPNKTLADFKSFLEQQSQQGETLPKTPEQQAELFKRFQSWSEKNDSKQHNQKQP